MRLNEDEPSVWRDERTKVRKWEVRKGIWRAGRRNAKKGTFKRERGWTLPDKNETVSWNWKLNTPGRWISTHKNCGFFSVSAPPVLLRPHTFSAHSRYAQSLQSNFYYLILFIFLGIGLNNIWRIRVNISGWNEVITEDGRTLVTSFFFFSFFSPVLWCTQGKKRCKEVCAWGRERNCSASLMVTAKESGAIKELQTWARGSRAEQRLGTARPTDRKPKTRRREQSERVGRRRAAPVPSCPPACQEMSGRVGGGMVMAAVGRTDWHPERPGRRAGGARQADGSSGKVTAGPGEGRLGEKTGMEQKRIMEEEEEDGWN